MPAPVITLPRSVRLALESEKADADSEHFLSDVFASYLRESDERVQLIDAEGLVIWSDGRTVGTPPGGQGEGPHLWVGTWSVDQRLTVLAAGRLAQVQGYAQFAAYSYSATGRRIEWNVGLSRVAPREGCGDYLIEVARERPGVDKCVKRQAAHRMVDGLTGLPAAVAFHNELRVRTLRKADRTAGFSLVMVDFDCFKQLNNRLGPHVCDMLLARFADCMAKAGDEAMFLARSGGDEFALIIDGYTDARTSVARMTRLLEGCAEHFLGGEPATSLSVSAGIARFPADASTDQELLRNAHSALRAAKEGGRARCVAFDGEMRQKLQRHEAMLSLARSAISGDRIRPYYQPKVDLMSGKVVGFEALLRWVTATGVVHLPGTISAALDDPAIATLISDIMIRKVIDDLSGLRAAQTALPVAINTSGADFRDLHFAARLLDKLGQAGIPPGLVEIEVTENVFLGDNADEVGVALRLLRGAGVRIALDDFGTGFASLTHLKKFPVDVIKIDQSFVNNLITSPDDRAIVRAMISLSQDLAIEVVAEGIETPAQVALLRGLGCQTGQGYFFSEALPGADISEAVGRIEQGAQVRAAMSA